MAYALLGLGSNLGERGAALAEGTASLAKTTGIRLVRQSEPLATSPIGGPPQPEYLNGAVLIETSLSPLELLRRCQAIEREAGRIRGKGDAFRWHPRPLDLDLLLYDTDVVRTPELEIPHPRMTFRRFVLEPAAQIAPEMVHPLVGWNLARLWRHWNEGVNLVAIATAEGSARSEQNAKGSARSEQTAKGSSGPDPASRLAQAIAAESGALWLATAEDIAKAAVQLQRNSPLDRRGAITLWQSLSGTEGIIFPIRPKLLLRIAGEENPRDSGPPGYEGPILDVSGDDPRSIAEGVAAIAALRDYEHEA